MKSGLGYGGKREMLARSLFWSGASFLLSQLPARDSLVVLNYHRIGNPDEDLFDPGVFSASADQFDNQISHLKRHVSLVTLEEALAYIEGSEKTKTRRCRVLVTFDDGYLDNYSIAFPILHAHGTQAVFFLATSMVGSFDIPWWDQIAYLVKNAGRRRYVLSYPANLAVDIDRNGFAKSLESILRSYKKPGNADPARFLRELEGKTEGKPLPETSRRFLNWDEAREMKRAGMEIGSHTHSHQVLGQLKPERQLEELSISRAILKQQLGAETNVLAYPVGSRTSFNRETQRMAREAGYRCAFSHHGGRNTLGEISPYDVKRTKMVNQSWRRFLVQTEVGRFSGTFWP
jgi:peptidoglycan/xylan/chitin deacetylase (PgdA/CDA1 family)